MGMDITKLLVKCGNCGYRFFTKKQALTKKQVNDRKGDLTNKVKVHQAELDSLTLELKQVNDSLTLELKKVNDSISKTKLIIREINKEYDDLDAIAQCKQCGLRFIVLDREVKE